MTITKEFTDYVDSSEPARALRRAVKQLQEARTAAADDAAKFLRAAEQAKTGGQTASYNASAMLGMLRAEERDRLDLEIRVRNLEFLLAHVPGAPVREVIESAERASPPRTEGEWLRRESFRGYLIDAALGITRVHRELAARTDGSHLFEMKAGEPIVFGQVVAERDGMAVVADVSQPSRCSVRGIAWQTSPGTGKIAVVAGCDVRFDEWLFGNPGAVYLGEEGRVTDKPRGDAVRVEIGTALGGSDLNATQVAVRRFR